MGRLWCVWWHVSSSSCDMYDMYPPPLYDMVRLWCVYLSLYLSISLSCSVPLARMCSLNNRLCSLRMSVVRLSLYPARSLARALSLFLSLSLYLSLSLSLSPLYLSLFLSLSVVRRCSTMGWQCGTPTFPSTVPAGIPIPTRHSCLCDG